MESPDNRLRGRVALVSGAASGIGAACANKLASAGAAVLVTDIDAQQGTQVVEAICAAGGRATFFQHDVTDETQWEQAVALCQAEFGGLNVLVNNAGIAIMCNILEMSLADWQRQQAINLDGVFLGCKHGLPLIDRSGGGAIINISSVAGMLGVPNLSSYSAAKGGVRNLSKTVAMHCTKKGYNIRCNAIHPGSIETPILAQVHHGPVEEWHVQARAKAIPMRRIGQPEEIAKPILFLASDDASFVTGQCYDVSGGRATY